MSRSDFPALADGVAYLDSAATGLRPQVVIDAMVRAAALGSPHRGVHRLAEAATDAVEDAREVVARFLGGAPDEIVFTSGTTAAIDGVAQSFVRPGEVVVASELEHHANLVPWRLHGAQLRLAPVDDRGRIDLDRLDLAGARLLAVAHVSNVTGTVAPIAELARRARAAGAALLVDGAQAVAHLDVDVAALGCDFYAFSAHKLYGPTGTGVLWGRRARLAAMPPWLGGGGMVASFADGTYRAPPARFEAGTPNTIGIAGLAAAIRYAPDRAGEAAAHAGLVDAVRAVGGRILGAPEVGVVSFAMDRVHPHDVASLLDADGVCVRAGHHCAQPIHARFGVDASVRASVGCYTDADDVARFARALRRVREVFP